MANIRKSCVKAHSQSTKAEQATERMVEKSAHQYLLVGVKYRKQTKSGYKNKIVLFSHEIDN